MRQRITLPPVTVRLATALFSISARVLITIIATSSGGRRTAPLSQPDNGLPITIKQQTGSGSTDLRGQHAYDQSAESLETRKEAAEALAARYRASREKLNEAA